MPYKASNYYEFNFDSMRTSDGELAPAYHDCRHTAYEGTLWVGDADVDAMDDVTIDDTHASSQTIVTNSVNSALEVFDTPVNGPYRYNNSQDDKGYYSYVSSHYAVYLTAEWGKDPYIPKHLWFHWDTEWHREWEPDPGCKPRETDLVSRQTDKLDLCNATRYGIRPVVDRWYPAPSLLYSDAFDIAYHYSIRHSDLVREALSTELEAEIPFSRLVYDAASRVRLLDINMISFIKEQSELIKGGYLRTLFHRDAAQEFDSVIKSTLSKPKKLRKAAKFVASEYLGMHYGTKLTALDYTDIAGAIIDLSELTDATQTMGSKKFYHDFRFPDGTTGTVLRRFKGTIRSLTDQDQTIAEAELRFMRKLYEVDILPTASNLWDLIPYSFVVDWFVPLGNKLEDIETGHYLETLHPLECFYSTNATYTLHVDTPFARNGKEFHLLGDISYKDYERKCSASFPDNVPCVEDPSGMTVTHGIEAGALLISRFA
jgi:hypothetical protein